MLLTIEPSLLPLHSPPLMTPTEHKAAFNPNLASSLPFFLFPVHIL